MDLFQKLCLKSFIPVDFSCDTRFYPTVVLCVPSIGAAQ